ncbi:MAG: sulfatase-like hydrolase/transferase [Bacteroidota bacterium]
MSGAKPLSIISFLVLFSLGCTSSSKEIPKPNILWIVLEDMSPQFIGAYGNAAAKTPVMDSLIQAGIQFNAAFSTGTVCSPSRYTLITGTRTNAYGTGHHRSAYPIPENIMPFPQLLREGGYYTTNNNKTDYNTTAARRFIEDAWDEGSGKAGWWGRADGQPFFSVFNFDNCHQSRTFTNPYDNYKGRILDKLAPEDQIADSEIILPDYYKDTPELRRELARTYNSLSYVDQEINTLLNRLKADNLLGSTIIFFYSDHGGGALRTKIVGNSLGHQIPMSVIIPQAYKALNPFKRKKSTQQPVTFEDFAPTVLQLAGLDIPAQMQGTPFLGKEVKKATYAFSSNDRSGECLDLTRSVSDGQFFYTRDFLPGKAEMKWMKYVDFSDSRKLARSYYQEGNLNQAQKMPFQTRPHEQLFNMQEDTWQVNNLAGNPNYAEKLKELSKALDEHLLKVKDVHFMPEYFMDSIAKITTPHEYAQSADYNFTAIYQAAKMTGDANTLPQQLELTKSDDFLIRYWASVGLASQSKTALELYKDDLFKLLGDSFPPTRILMASTLFRHFASVKGEAILEQHLNHPNPYLALQTIQEIIYLPDDKKLLFKDAITALQASKPKSGLLTESIDIYFYLVEGKPLFYAHFW